MASLFSFFVMAGASALLGGASLSTASGLIHGLVQSSYFQVGVLVALVLETVLATVTATDGRSNSDSSSPKRFRLKNKQKDTSSRLLQFVIVMASLFSFFEMAGASASLRSASHSTASGWFEVGLVVALVSVAILGIFTVTTGGGHKRVSLKTKQKDELEAGMRSIKNIPKFETGKIDFEKFCGLVRQLPVIKSLDGPKRKLVSNEYLRSFAVLTSVFQLKDIGRKKRTTISKEQRDTLLECIRTETAIPDHLQMYKTPNRMCRLRKVVAAAAEEAAQKARASKRAGGRRGGGGRRSAKKSKQLAKKERDKNATASSTHAKTGKRERSSSTSTPASPTSKKKRASSTDDADKAEHPTNTGAGKGGTSRKTNTPAWATSEKKRGRSVPDIIHHSQLGGGRRTMQLQLHQQATGRTCFSCCIPT